MTIYVTADIRGRIWITKNPSLDVVLDTEEPAVFITRGPAGRLYVTRWTLGGNLDRMTLEPGAIAGVLQKKGLW